MCIRDADSKCVCENNLAVHVLFSLLAMIHYVISFIHAVITVVLLQKMMSFYSK